MEKIKDLKNENYLPKIREEKKRIIVFIKDVNYHNQVAQGSHLAIADIENYRESFNLLLENNFSIERTGDSTQKNFSFFIVISQTQLKKLFNKKINF